jgi:KipI family sensor histidine kinase inhibitor
VSRLTVVTAGDGIAIRALGDTAVLVELGTAIDIETNRRVFALAGGLQALAIDGVRDVVPAYASVAVHYDPSRLGRETVVDMVRALLRQPVPSLSDTQPAVDVPVCYDPSLGPDLLSVASATDRTVAEVAAIHAGAVYRVFMLGFLPGFAYMGVVDSRIAVPRHPTPRARVAAGSVGIAGSQTGVYPRDSPGGWQIIGRTPLCLFDPARTPAAVLSPGGSVRFVPITRHEFDAAAPRGGA